MRKWIKALEEALNPKHPAKPMVPMIGERIKIGNDTDIVTGYLKAVERVDVTHKVSPWDEHKVSTQLSRAPFKSYNHNDMCDIYLEWCTWEQAELVTCVVEQYVWLHHVERTGEKVSPSREQTLYAEYQRQLDIARRDRPLLHEALNPKHAKAIVPEIGDAIEAPPMHGLLHHTVTGYLTDVPIKRTADEGEIMLATAQWGFLYKCNRDKAKFVATTGRPGIFRIEDITNIIKPDHPDTRRPVEEALNPKHAEALLPDVGDTVVLGNEGFTVRVLGYLKRPTDEVRHNNDMYTQEDGRLVRCPREEAEFIRISSEVFEYAPLHMIRSIKRKTVREALSPRLAKAIIPHKGDVVVYGEEGFTSHLAVEGFMTSKIEDSNGQEAGSFTVYREGTSPTVYFCDREKAEYFFTAQHTQIFNINQIKSIIPKPISKPKVSYNFNRTPMNESTYEKFADVLVSAQDIADYMVEYAGADMDYDVVEEYFEGARATLKMVPIDDLTEDHEDINIRNPELEAAYEAMTTPMPPLIVVNGIVKDGNHRLRVARKKGMMTVPCYVVEWDEDEY